MTGRPCVTIFSDGSYLPSSGRASWGAVFVTDAGRVQEGGEFRAPCASAHEAEVKAAANALHRAGALGLLGGGPYVVLQIDSEAAIATILASDARYFYSCGPHPRDLRVIKPSWVPKACTPAIVKIRELVLSLDLRLTLRHVKGHAPGLSSRHSLNARADSIARASIPRAKSRRRA